jgi:hypothetical protein
MARPLEVAIPDEEIYSRLQQMVTLATVPADEMAGWYLSVRRFSSARRIRGSTTGGRSRGAGSGSPRSSACVAPATT